MIGRNAKVIIKHNQQLIQQLRMVLLPFNILKINSDSLGIPFLLLHFLFLFKLLAYRGQLFLKLLLIVFIPADDEQGLLLLLFENLFLEFFGIRGLIAGVAIDVFQIFQIGEVVAKLVLRLLVLDTAHVVLVFFKLLQIQDLLLLLRRNRHPVLL